MQAETAGGPLTSGNSPWLTNGGAAAVGACALAAQVALAREAAAIWGGNEFILGVFLCAWLLLTAGGSFLGGLASMGRFHGPAGLMAAFAALPVGFVVSAVAVRAIHLLAVAGAMPPVSAAIWAIPLALAPFCLPSGALFAWLATRPAEARAGENSAGPVFLFETLGSALAGGATGLLLAGRISTIHTAWLCTVVCLAVILAAAWTVTAARAVALVLAAAVLMVGFPGSFLAERLSTPWQYPGVRLVERVESPYGSLARVQAGGETDVYADGAPVFAGLDQAWREQTAHFVMAANPAAEKIALLGVAACTLAEEAAKYGPRETSCIEINTDLLKLATERQGWPATLTAVAQDPRAWLKVNANYDVIIAALPPPGTIGQNRYYTREFFALARAALSATGVFAFGLPAQESYRGPEQRRLLSAVGNALRAVFPEVALAPGEYLIFVASALPVRIEVLKVLAERGITAVTITPTLVADRLSGERRGELSANLRSTELVNRDYAPSAYLAQLELWLAQFGESLLWPLLAIGALLAVAAVVLARGRNFSLNLAVSTTGAAGMGGQFLLLLGYQLSQGALWRDLSLLFAAFMAGMAAGSFLSRRWGPRLVIAVDALAALAMLALAFVFQTSVIEAHPGLFTGWATGVGLAGFGALVGLQFPAAASKTSVREAAALYAADLAGSCLAALTVPLVLIPVAGFQGAALALGVLKLASLFNLAREARSRRVESRPLPANAILAAGLFGGLVLFSIPDALRFKVYAFSFSTEYLAAVWLVLLLIFFAAFRFSERSTGPLFRVSERLRGALSLARPAWLKTISGAAYVVLLPAVLLPLARCYFIVPWFFCHVCPRECVFGYLRPYLIGTALLSNLGTQPWCGRVCPAATLQDAVNGRPPKSRLRRALWLPRLAILAAVAATYFLVEQSAERTQNATGPLFLFFYRNAYEFSLAVVLVVLGFLLLSRWIRRSFCSTLCPVGTCSDLLASALRKTLPVGSAPETPHET